MPLNHYTEASFSHPFIQKAIPRSYFWGKIACEKCHYEHPDSSLTVFACLSYKIDARLTLLVDASSPIQEEPDAPRRSVNLYWREKVRSGTGLCGGDVLLRIDAVSVITKKLLITLAAQAHEIIRLSIVRRSFFLRESLRHPLGALSL
jgi:hypothetical protein